MSTLLKVENLSKSYSLSTGLFGPARTLDALERCQPDRRGR